MIARFIQQVRELGVSCWLEGGEIQVSSEFKSVDDRVKSEFFSRRAEIVSHLSWEHIQKRSELRFGWHGARLYPFFRLGDLKLREFPRPLTSLGPCRLLSIDRDGADVVYLENLQRYWINGDLPKGKRTGLSDFYPPLEPPDSLLHSEELAELGFLVNKGSAGIARPNC